MKNKTIPIVVGVSGHRKIASEDREAISAAVRETLVSIQNRCRHSEVMLLNSLAEGGDLLCADVARALGIPILVPLPLERTDYENDFSETEKEHFASHCDAAAECFVVSPIEKREDMPKRDFAYRQASIYVATHAHILLALWDGSESAPNGCGTAFAVDAALHDAFCSPEGASPDGCRTVVQIYTPRGERSDYPAGTKRILGAAASFEELCDRTDEFNRLASDKDTGKAYPVLPEELETDAALDRFAEIHAAAETLSNGYSKRFRWILALLSIASTVLTMAFLLYDEAELHWMILICGAMLLSAFFLRRIAERTAAHRRYLEYRTLEEGVRVQIYLRYAGSRVEPAALMTWTQKQETGWVASALAVLGIGPAPVKSHDISDCWIEDQRVYHEKASARAKRRRGGSEGVVRTALWISILLYLSALLFEILCGLFGKGILPPFDADPYRTLLKILLGSVSAAALFISNYYGKLSLSRKHSDHEKMERFFRHMEERLKRQGQSEALLLVLAREELSENGNWCSYQRDNTPDFSI